LIRGIDRYDPAGAPTLEQYLWRTVRREMLGELHRQDLSGAAWSRQASAADLLASADPANDPELASELHEAKQRFRAAFGALPARDRHVAVMLYVDELTLREIGELLGVSESRVCQIHAELRRELRLTLADDASLFAAVA
jgi:RNA polymerase sigma factor (sigma-70 family)